MAQIYGDFLGFPSSAPASGGGTAGATGDQFDWREKK